MDNILTKFQNSTDEKEKAELGAIIFARAKEIITEQTRIAEDYNNIPPYENSRISCVDDIEEATKGYYVHKIQPNRIIFYKFVEGFLFSAYESIIMTMDDMLYFDKNKYEKARADETLDFLTKKKRRLKLEISKLDKEINKVNAKKEAISDGDDDEN
jgi:DNA-directed RNA polymerase subunit K/omega